ncbi:hypothetical protein CB1_000576062, partial [Camelus ferus]
MDSLDQKLEILGKRQPRARARCLCFPGAAAAATAKMPPPSLEMGSGQVLPAFLLCSTLLVIKMYVVAIITGQVRLRKKASGEDGRLWQGPGPGEPRG